MYFIESEVWRILRKAGIAEPHHCYSSAWILLGNNQLPFNRIERCTLLAHIPAACVAYSPAGPQMQVLCHLPRSLASRLACIDA